MICYPEATESVPWVEGLTPPEASHYLPSVVFNCRPLWPVAAKPKGLLLARFITWLSVQKSSCMLDGRGRVQGVGGGGDMTSRGTCLCDVNQRRKTGSDTEMGKRTRGCALLGAFAKFRKANIGFIMSACPHGTKRLALGGFS